MHKGWLIVTTSVLVACGGGGESQTAAVSVAKSLGSLQCSGGGTTLSALQAQLLNAGVQVVAASCGLDGVSYPAVCGMPDGAIAVFDVSPLQQAAAQALGFVLLSSLPNAVKQACH